MTDLKIPTVHMNGTSADDLIKQLKNAYQAIGVAVRALAEAAPNGRDYYPQGSDAAQEAIRQHRLRMAKLDSVREELIEIVSGVQDQIDERARQRANPRKPRRGYTMTFRVDGELASYEDLVADNPDDEYLQTALASMDVGETMEWGGGAFATTIIERVR